MSGTFRFLDDIAMADMAFEAQGDSLSELFEAATEALIQSLADPASVAQTWQQTIELEEPDIGTLLFEWLNRLVYLKDAQAVVFHHATLSLHPTPGQSGWRLHAKLVGAQVDQTTQDLRSDVKGVTKHLYAVTQSGNSWKTRVVLDV